MPSSKSEGRRLAIPIALLYGALFLVYGTQIPFMPVWLDWRGLSASEISIVVATPYFLRLFVTPAVAMAADRSGAHRRYVVVLSWLSLIFVLALAGQAFFWPILFFAVLLTIADATSMPLLETIAIEAVRARGLDYGRMRLWGSLTFVLASFVCGIAITHLGGGAAIWLIAIGCAATAFAAHGLPSSGVPETAGKSNRVLWKAAELRELLARRDFRLFLISAGLVQSAHAAFYTFGTLIWQKQGYSATWCGALWAIGVAAEVLLFSFSREVGSRVGPALLIAFAAAASIVRWGVLAFEPPLAILVPLQLLHGATFGASHIGAMHFIHDAVPRDRSGTAQALYSTVAAGIAMGCTTLIAGWLYPSAGAFTYLAMAASSAVSLGAALRLMRVGTGAPLAAEPLNSGLCSPP
jgi:PPP family 3-phenylpropionic acid transporter